MYWRARVNSFKFQATIQSVRFKNVEKLILKSWLQEIYYLFAFNFYEERVDLAFGKYYYIQVFFTVFLVCNRHKNRSGISRKKNISERSRT